MIAQAGTEVNLAKRDQFGVYPERGVRCQVINAGNHPMLGETHEDCRMTTQPEDRSAASIHAKAVETTGEWLSDQEPLPTQWELSRQASARVSIALADVPMLDFMIANPSVMKFKLPDFRSPHDVESAIRSVVVEAIGREVARPIEIERRNRFAGRLASDIRGLLAEALPVAETYCRPSPDALPTRMQRMAESLRDGDRDAGNGAVIGRILKEVSALLFSVAFESPMRDVVTCRNRIEDIMKLQETDGPWFETTLRDDLDLIRATTPASLVKTTAR